MSAPRLTTDRLVLRAWQDDDLVPFAALNADPEVMEFFPAPLTSDEAAEFAGRHQALLEAGEPGVFAVEVAATSEFIGFIGLAVPRFEAAFTPCVEVGWRLARSAWGHGYAAEGAQAALQHGFGTLGLDEIVSFTSEINRRSRAVMVRLQMEHDPTEDFDHPRIADGDRLQRHVLYRRTGAPTR
ncbi:MAG: hypothetical protein JWP74_3240 [Marmoricola sp.]|nr:hypothetical protein [Marmoricola sp.]